MLLTVTFYIFRAALWVHFTNLHNYPVFMPNDDDTFTHYTYLLERKGGRVTAYFNTF